MKKFVSLLAFVLLVLSFYSCNKEQNAYTNAKKANSIEALKEFATNYPNGDYIDSAKGIIDSMIWQPVLIKDSLRCYKKFIDEYPKSRFIATAKGIFYNKMWQEVISSNTIDDYETFIDEYPDSKFIDSAKNMIKKLKPL